jgi:hypothetical protein
MTIFLPEHHFLSLRMSKSSSIAKARILCLHGDGTNAEIFKAQSRHIRKALENEFELVYINGPFECDAGYGVKPIFDGCGPFFSWTTRGQGLEADDAEDLSQGVVFALADLAWEYDNIKTAFDGILGFSSSAGVIAGIMKDQSYAETYGTDSPIRFKFKFGVIINGHGHPLRIGSATSKIGLPGYTTHLISIPSVHTHGLRDEWLQNSRLLGSYFSEDDIVRLDFDTDHRVPTAEDDVSQLAREILKLREAGKHGSEVLR